MTTAPASLRARELQVAALFVDANGCYVGVPGVDPWPASRDARLYAGPWPVVAHPPCERWGRFAEDAIGAARWGRPRKQRGDDGGCFASALASVRAWGGVLEHPADSHAWAAHGLCAPPRSGGWVSAGDWRGWTCCVEQGHYGHRARKATWLYAVGVTLSSLVWGPSTAAAYVSSPPKGQRQRYRVRLLCPRERRSTPVPFRDLLLSMARSVRPLALEAAS